MELMEKGSEGEVKVEMVGMGMGVQSEERFNLKLLATMHDDAAFSLALVPVDHWHRLSTVNPLFHFANNDNGDLFFFFRYYYYYFDRRPSPQRHRIMGPQP